MTESTPRQAWAIATASDKDSVEKSFIVTSLSAALAGLNKRVCLLDTSTDLSICRNQLGRLPEFTLQDLSIGVKELAGIVLEGPAGVRILPAGGVLSEFIHLNSNQQARVISTLVELESEYDCIIIDTSAGNDNAKIQLLQAAPSTILIMTPEPASLTDSYSLLNTLKHFYYDHPVYVVVNQAGNLPDAHDTFNRFRQATLKYLQLDPRYLGSILSDGVPAGSNDLRQPMLLHHPNAVSSQCLISLANRLNRIMIRQASPAEGFSHYFSKLRVLPDPRAARVPRLSAQVGKKNPERAIVAQREQAVCDRGEQPTEIEDLRAAAHYAGLLEKKERNNT